MRGPDSLPLPALRTALTSFGALSTLAVAAFALLRVIQMGQAALAGIAVSQFTDGIATDMAFQLLIPQRTAGCDKDRTKPDTTPTGIPSPMAYLSRAVSGGYLALIPDLIT